MKNKSKNRFELFYEINCDLICCPIDFMIFNESLIKNDFVVMNDV